MRFTKNNILKSFDNYEPRVLDFLEYVLDELKAKDKIINNYTLVILQLLASQLSVYFKAQDEIVTNVTETSDTKYGSVRKVKPEVVVFNQTHKEITRLLDKLCISPLEKAKVKRLNSTEENNQAEGTQILGNLLNSNFN